MSAEDTAKGDKYEEMMQEVHDAAKQHAFRERFRAMVELYIKHISPDELHRIVVEKDMHCVIAEEPIDMFSTSIDDEIERRWEAFKEYEEQARGEQ